MKNANRVKRSAAIFLATYVTGVETTGEAGSSDEERASRSAEEKKSLANFRGIATMATKKPITLCANCLTQFNFQLISRDIFSR